jgi:hypothetical protein
MRAWAILVVVSWPVLAAPTQDDASLRRLLVGTWSMLPPITFRSDGTWTDGQRVGNWQIVHQRLMRNWRSPGDTSDWNADDEIIELNRDRLRMRPTLHRDSGQPDRTPFPSVTLRRIAHDNVTHHK